MILPGGINRAYLATRPVDFRKGHAGLALIVQSVLGHLPEHLPRIERVIEPDSILCSCGCGEPPSSVRVVVRGSETGSVS